MTYIDPPWLHVARGYIGQHEIAGTKHNPLILRWWVAIHAPYSDDETPWCGAFVGGCLEEVGIRSARSASALAYRNYGFRLEAPAVGCIAVKRRFNRLGKIVGGHVTYPVGRDRHGNIICLGGNQNDGVNTALYPAGVFTDYRWPVSPLQLKPNYELPIYDNAAAAGKEA